MANRKKPEADKATEAILIRVTPGLKIDVEAMAEATSVATSERVRICLAETVRRWKAGELDKSE